MMNDLKFLRRVWLGRLRPSAFFPAPWLLALGVACTDQQPHFLAPGSSEPANDVGTPAEAPSAVNNPVVEPTSEVAATRTDSAEAPPTPQLGVGTPSHSATPDAADAHASSSGSDVADGSSDDPAPPSATGDPAAPAGDPAAPPGDPAAPPGDPAGAAGNGSAGALIRGGDPTLQSAASAGPFDVDTLSAGLRDGPDYGTQTLHFPTDAEPPFAAVAVVPGFSAPESSIRSWGPFLASHGIIALTIGTNSPSDSPDARADALLDALETIKAENTRSGGPLAGKVDVTRLGVMGWSMGGGGTLITANAHPELKAAITLAAWSPGERFSTDRVPTLLFAGSADTLAGGQSQGFFASIPATTPKMMYEVDGGSHSVANNPNGAGGEVGRYGLSWLKVFLEGDQRYRQFLLLEPSRDSEFLQNLTDGL
jgi:dienelactone hydrolase